MGFCVMCYSVVCCFLKTCGKSFHVSKYRLSFNDWILLFDAFPLTKTLGQTSLNNKDILKILMGRDFGMI